MNIKLKIFLTFFISFTFVLLFYSKISACTYNATIKGNHLDFQVTSDVNNLAVIQYRRLSGDWIITNVYSPDIGIEWNYFNDPDCVNNNGKGTIACKQNGGTGEYWSYEIPSGTYHLLPNGIYGLDFNTTPNYDGFEVQYGIIPGTTGEHWGHCTRTGDIINTPSPTPTPVPTTKTVFAPGLMASWNTEAILNCSTDTNTEWTLAPYAKDVYEPIYQTLNESGWSTLPFYYDWRQKISYNSQQLADFIDRNVVSDEKVNFVGHSMGGLIGRAYLEASEGSKLESLLTVGTPNKGSAYAYYPWEGGEVKRNSLIEKIALTLYLKHCGGKSSTNRQTIHNNVPSLQDLLPIEEYLKKNGKTALYLPASTENQNNWLETLTSNNYGIKLGYIAGTGIDTLKTIITTNPKKKDIKNGDWVDGKPRGEITSEQGDGTVLVSSATLPNTSEENSYLIEQDHRSLVNSTEGMSKILEFLGTPQTLSSQSLVKTESNSPDSALIIIGYPADFIVTHENGKTVSDENGIVAFMNPGSGSYKVNLISKSNNTLFIVAQFLPNGEIKYKEYNLKGLGPKFKKLNLDIQNPQEDILVN